MPRVISDAMLIELCLRAAQRGLVRHANSDNVRSSIDLEPRAQLLRGVIRLDQLMLDGDVLTDEEKEIIGVLN
jgi:hypothetical protein